MQLKKGNFSLTTNTGETAMLAGAGIGLALILKGPIEKLVDKIKKFTVGKNGAHVDCSQDDSKKTPDTDRQR